LSWSPVVSDLNSRASSFSARSVTGDSVASTGSLMDRDHNDCLDGPAPTLSAGTVDVVEDPVLPSKTVNGEKKDRRPTSILHRAVEKAAAGARSGRPLSKTASAEREWFANWLDASRRCASPRGSPPHLNLGESDPDVAMESAIEDDCISQGTFPKKAKISDEGEDEQDQPLVPPPGERPPAMRERIIASKIADHINTEYFQDTAQVEGGTIDQRVFAVAAPDDLESKQHRTVMKINLPITSCRISHVNCNEDESSEETARVKVIDLTFEETADHLLKFLKSQKGETYTQTQLLAKMLRIKVVVDDQGATEAESAAESSESGDAMDNTVDASGAVHLQLTLLDGSTPANLKARIQEFDADTVTKRQNHMNKNPFVGSVRNASLFEQAVSEKVPVGTSKKEELKRAVVLLNKQSACQHEVIVAGTAGDHLATGGLVNVNDEAWWGDRLARMRDILMMLGQRRKHMDSPECECKITRNTNAQVDPLFDLAQVYANKKEEIEARLRALRSGSSAEANPKLAPAHKAGLQDDSGASRESAIVMVSTGNAQLKYVPRVAAYWYLLRSFVNLHLRDVAVERDLFINHLPNLFYSTVFGISHSRPSVTEFAAVTAPKLCAKLRDALDAKLKVGQAGTREAQELAAILEQAMDLYITWRAKLHGKTEAAMAEQMREAGRRHAHAQAEIARQLELAMQQENE